MPRHRKTAKRLAALSAGLVLFLGIVVGGEAAEDEIGKRTKQRKMLRKSVEETKQENLYQDRSGDISRLDDRISSQSERISDARLTGTKLFADAKGGDQAKLRKDELMFRKSSEMELLHRALILRLIESGKLHREEELKRTKKKQLNF